MDETEKTTIVSSHAELMKRSDVLRLAGDLLAQPGAWTQHSFARDDLGADIMYNRPEAVCWCALGAIRKIAFEHGGSVFNAFNLLSDVLDEPVTVWNDAEGRTQEEVIEAFRKAEERAKRLGL